MAIRIQGHDMRVMLRRLNQVSAHPAIDERTVALTGCTGNNGVSFCCVLRAVGGNVHRVGDMLRVQGDCVLLVISATSFREGNDLIQSAINRLDTAEKLGYEARKRRHLDDFRPLMDACQLNLVTDASLLSLPHDKRLQRVQEGHDDFGLICDMFAMGRYLLISSSRPGSQPANLQGIWNQEFSPASSPSISTPK